MSKQQALDQIARFEKVSMQAFKTLDRATVASDLRARVENPYSISQAQAGICGPASIAFSILQSRPYTYVLAATQLFNVGVGWVGDWKIKPDDDLLAAACPRTVPQGDWVMLASIRDSENWMLDFHDESDNYSSASTLTEIEDWMKKAGFKDVVCEEGVTNIFDKTDMLKAAIKKYDEGYHVILRISADCIDSKIPSAPIAGNHVVVLVETPTIPPKKQDPIQLPIYTWGQKITLPRKGGLTYEQFLQQFFGYVAAKDS